MYQPRDSHEGHLRRGGEIKPARCPGNVYELIELWVKRQADPTEGGLNGPHQHAFLPFHCLKRGETHTEHD